MKQIRIVLWFLVALAAGGACFLWLNANSQQTQQTSVERYGGDFSLVRHDGSEITQRDLVGKRHAMFFGFTHCPDVCPTTLLQASGWLKQLDDDANKIDFYFISVDPARDTPEVLNDYVGAFDPRITGITGSEADVSQMLKSYGVYAKRVNLEGDDYTMDHSAFVMLIDSNGAFKGTISFNENEDTAMAKLRRLIEKG